MPGFPCCCFKCPCSGGRPNEITVEIQGPTINGACQDCSDIENTYVLTNPVFDCDGTGFFSCTYSFVFTAPLTCTYTSLICRIQFDPFGGGTYGLRVSLKIDQTEVVLWSKNLGASAPDCESFNETLAVGLGGGLCTFQGDAIVTS